MARSLSVIRLAVALAIALAVALAGVLAVAAGGREVKRSVGRVQHCVPYSSLTCLCYLSYTWCTTLVVLRILPGV